MNTPTKKAVYLPKATFPLSMKGEVGELFSLQQGYFFTPEQLNEYTANVIKDALNTAAENAYVDFEDYDKEFVNKKSITNTFEKIFQKYKI